MRQLSAYLAHQLGFSQTGRYILGNLIIPRIEEIGIKVIDPFVECDKHFNADYLESLERYEDRRKYLEEFSRKITPINNRKMDESHCLAAILDGGHAVDDGVAGEIGYYTGIRRGPIFAVRSDFRCGENMAVSINPQLLGYILQSGGKLVDGKNSLDRWFLVIKEWYESYAL